MNLTIVAEALMFHHSQQNKDEKPYTEYLDILQSKDKVLGRFQAEFAPRAIHGFSVGTFRDFLSFKHNKHWTGLQRPTSHVCDDMPKLRAAITHLFDESVPVIERIDNLTKHKEMSVPGISVGILTPLLLVRFPEKYGVWNSKAESALNMLGILPHFTKGSSKGQKYNTLNTLYLQLANMTGLDLWSLDGLWHVINERCRVEIKQDLEDEDNVHREYFEGKKKLTSGYTYERDAKAREQCILYYGPVCVVCKFDFFQFYGELGFGFIHVHHVTDIAMQGGARINPKNDLVPVCPNCHAMLHRYAKPARSPDKLREIIDVLQSESKG